MIIDLEKFINAERPFWDELRKLLDSMAKEPHFRMDLEKTRRFHYLYQRASADLAKIMTFSSERR